MTDESSQKPLEIVYVTNITEKVGQQGQQGQQGGTPAGPSKSQGCLNVYLILPNCLL